MKTPILSKLRKRANDKFAEGKRIEQYIGNDGGAAPSYVVQIGNGNLTIILNLIDEMAKALEYANNVIEGEWPQDQWDENGVYRNRPVLARYQEMMK